jgi:LmbE family N-acetylglucosaminyl deacetylase
MTASQLNRRVALAFLAHPDDAEFLCAGTLIRLADLGWEVHIATATAGDCGTATLSREEIARIRRGEGAAAAARIGATYHCTGESDLHVFYDSPTNQKVIDLFRQVAPSLVFAHPRRDYMLDHEQAHLLARNAAFSYPVPNSSWIERHPDSAVPWVYYCDPIEGKDPYTGEPATPSVRVDISAVIDRKIEMLACHASQREWLRSHHGIDEYIEAMKKHGAMRGAELGVAFAEAFAQHRGHAYPQSDLLAEQMGDQASA